MKSATRIMIGTIVQPNSRVLLPWILRQCVGGLGKRKTAQMMPAVTPVYMTIEITRVAS
jgi:hypothetical protein